MGRNLLFQSTPPRRRRPQQTNPDDIHGGISIHASAKEATRSCEGCRKRCGFQSTPPRRRRPFFGTGTIGILLISIHASAKEATDTTSDNVYTFVISIHASAKEATATYCDTSAIMYISSLNNFFVHYF